MMGLIGQGCEHGDVLEVTGTNTPTQKTPLCFSCVGDENSKIDCAKNQCVCRKKKNDYCVCVCCTVFDATRCPYPIGCGGGLFQIGFVLVVLASRVRPVPFRSR